MALSDAQSGSRPLILLVEDEVLTRVAIAMMLERAGFRVMPVASAEEALQVLAAAPDIRAVVTDVGLSSGGMNGFELARKIRSERGMGVVVVSGRATPEDELPAGVYFIAKPLHGSTLVELVRQAVGSPGAPDRPSERPATRSEHEVAASEADAAHALTLRQRSVLELLVQGKSNRDIALALDLAENTVKVHMAAIFRALGVSSRTEAVLVGLRLFQHQPDVDQSSKSGTH